MHVRIETGGEGSVGNAYMRREERRGEETQETLLTPPCV
jgi:hypothetical protein